MRGTCRAAPQVPDSQISEVEEGHSLSSLFLSRFALSPPPDSSHLPTHDRALLRRTTLPPLPQPPLRPRPLPPPSDELRRLSLDALRSLLLSLVSLCFRRLRRPTSHAWLCTKPPPRPRKRVTKALIFLVELIE